MAQRSSLVDVSPPQRRAQPAATQPSPSGPTLSRLVRPQDVCLLVRQLATLLHAGMPVVPALEALREQLDDGRGRTPPTAHLVRHLHDRVSAGAALSQALRDFPGLFGPLTVSMVVAGEAGGTLDGVLSRLADNLERRRALAAKVKAAAAYPVTLAVVAVGVVVFLLSHVVPSITRIFLEMKRDLPAPTRLLIAVSGFTERNLALLALLLLGAGLGLWAYYRSARGRSHWDACVLRLPLVGGLVTQVEVSRLARTLGMLLAGGVPILQALEVTHGLIQNTELARAWQTVHDEVQRGRNLAEAMKQTRCFPPVVCHVVATGQNSGSLESSLFNVADMFDTQLEAGLRTLTSLLEPAILLVMGALVGFVVMAILLPIFDINQAL